MACYQPARTQWLVMLCCFNQKTCLARSFHKGRVALLKCDLRNPICSLYILYYHMSFACRALFHVCMSSLWPCAFAMEPTMNKRPSPLGPLFQHFRLRLWSALLSPLRRLGNRAAKKSIEGWGGDKHFFFNEMTAQPVHVSQLVKSLPHRSQRRDTITSIYFRFYFCRDIMIQEANFILYLRLKQFQRYTAD